MAAMNRGKVKALAFGAMEEELNRVAKEKRMAALNRGKVKALAIGAMEEELGKIRVRARMHQQMASTKMPRRQKDDRGSESSGSED